MDNLDRKGHKTKAVFVIGSGGIKSFAAMGRFEFLETQGIDVLLTNLSMGKTKFHKEGLWKFRPEKKETQCWFQ
jgi:hypothetical protein